MTSKVKLQCCLYRPNGRRALRSVEIATDEKIYDLRRVIYENVTFRAHVKETTTENLDLFRVSIPDDKIERKLNVRYLTTLTTLLSPTSRAPDAYAEQPSDDSTHILIVMKAGL